MVSQQWLCCAGGGRGSRGSRGARRCRPWEEHGARRGPGWAGRPEPSAHSPPRRPLARASGGPQGSATAVNGGPGMASPRGRVTPAQGGPSVGGSCARLCIGGAWPSPGLAPPAPGEARREWPSVAQCPGRGGDRPPTQGDGGQPAACACPGPPGSFLPCRGSRRAVPQRQASSPVTASTVGVGWACSKAASCC